MRKTEQQRDTVRRQAAKELAIVATPSPIPTTKSQNR
jgi:hypothetical protein